MKFVYRLTAPRPMRVQFTDASAQPRTDVACRALVISGSAGASVPGVLSGDEFLFDLAQADLRTYANGAPRTHKCEIHCNTGDGWRWIADISIVAVGIYSRGSVTEPDGSAEDALVIVLPDDIGTGTPTFSVPATISPASGPVGTVFTLALGSAAGTPVGVLRLDGNDVTSAIANGQYTSTSAGVLTWTVTAGEAVSADSAIVTLSGEQLQDIVGAMFAGEHSGATVDYDDAAGTITITTFGGTGGGLTPEQTEDIVASLIDAGVGLSVAYDDAASSLTIGLSGESFSAADKTKLDGIAAGATANATDAQLRDRATHTGTQAIGTVTGLQTALDGKAALAQVPTLEEMQDLVGAMFGGAHSNATVAYDDVTGAITISAVGGSGGGLTQEQAEDIVASLIDAGSGITAVYDDAASSLTIGLSGQSFSAADKTKLDGISPGATVNSTDTALRDRATHTGTQAIGTVTGLQTALDGKAPLASVLSTEQVEDIAANLIDAGAGVAVTYDDAASSLTIGLSGQSFSTAEQTKLAGIASGATVNATDAQLRDRATHTGTQAIGTVNGLQLALDAKAPLDAVLSTEEMQDLVGAMFTGAHTNATVAYDDATGAITISATGGAGGGSNLTLSDVPGPLTAPYVQSATLTQDATEVDLPTGYISQIDVRRFGVQMVPFGQDASEAVATANRTALQAALDWSSASAGVVAVPGGRLDIYGGSLVLPIGAAIRGMSQFSTQIRQRQRPTSLAETFTSIFTAPPVVGAAGGNGYNIISDMMIDGGWNIRNFEGATHVNWAHDPARMTQVAIQTDTPVNGPVASASRDAGSDAQSRFFNLTIRNVAGTALDLRGRGEIMVSMVELAKSGKHGLDISAPDCFIHMLTSYTTGDSAAVIRAGAGNLRMTNSKFWFTGMQSAAECVGAGVHLPDQGTTAIEMHAVSTQDTWGPGLDLAGNTGIYFNGDIDEAGGGRTTEQGFGFSGARTLPRSCLRLTGTLRRADINARVRGGGRNGAANRPVLVDLRGSGVMGCRLRLNGDLTNIATVPIVEATGYTNARRYNVVDFFGRLMHGAMTKAQLDDPTHGVNDALYGPTEVTMTDGRTAKKNSAGAWVIPRLSVQITQAAYDALTPKDPDTDYYIVG